jgi:hypothetical protein
MARRSDDPVPPDLEKAGVPTGKLKVEDDHGQWRD